MPQLQITLPNGHQLTRELSEDTLTVGRLPENDLPLDDISVSSRHAELVLVNGDYLLKDLQSTNGTKVNGDRCKEWELQDGDQIIFGKVKAAYSSEIPATKRSLPEAGERKVELSSQSHRPSDFTNASRFKTKAKKKSPAGMAGIGIFVLALLTFLGAIATILSIQAPV
jgi:pSer/pThr/pTyr-binding forkhead associated (FHA) protein